MKPHEVQGKEVMKKFHCSRVRTTVKNEPAKKDESCRMKIEKNQYKQGHFKSWKDENCHLLLKFKILEKETEYGWYSRSSNRNDQMYRCHWGKSLARQVSSYRPSQDNRSWGRQEDGEQDSKRGSLTISMSILIKAKHMWSSLGKDVPWTNDRISYTDFYLHYWKHHAVFVLNKIRK